MTLLSSPCVTPSANTETASLNDIRTVTYSPSPSTSPTPTTVNGPTPSQVLAMTIRKKRKALRRRDRNLRVEILLTSTIRHLCQEIGDHLRARRMANNKRKSPAATPEHEEADGSSTPTVSPCAAKRNRTVVEDRKQEEVGHDEASSEAPQSSSVCSVGPLALDDQNADTHSTPSRSDHIASTSSLKRKAEAEEDNLPCKRVPISSSSSTTEDSFNEKDPFGLDDFFRSLRTCRVGGSKR